MANATFVVSKCRSNTSNRIFWIKGNLIVIEDVPAGVCPQCGEKVVNAATGQQITSLLVDQKSVQAARKIRVPVISLLEKAA